MESNRRCPTGTRIVSGLVDGIDYAILGKIKKANLFFFLKKKKKSEVLQPARKWSSSGQSIITAH
jgi:hypothetical protein